MNKKSFFILVFLLPFSLSAQIITVPFNSKDVIIDGVLNELEWFNAIPLGEFHQIRPNLGSKSTEEVSVNIMYDQDYLYIGAVINYKDPSQMFSTTFERDNEQSNDDYIEILIDTYNDKINSLAFRTNPLGAKQDFEVSNNDANFNTSWNTFWVAKSKINIDNWSTEIKIPFSSLRYQKSNENIMRIKAVVNYKEKNERIIYPLNNTAINAAQYHFSNSQEILLKNLPSSKTLYFVPYIKGTALKQNTLNSDESNYNSSTTFLDRKHYVNNSALDKIISNIGLDLKYKVNSNQTIDLTLNTDFAEVEADDRIINISRFPILLPEKRQFFLENADVFNSNQFGHRLFNSRQIGIQNGQEVPIIGGIRFVGSNEKWQYGILDMQTQNVENLTLSTNMSVARFRRNFGKLGSNIGFINTNRINKDDSNHLVALDANLQFTENVRLRVSGGITFDVEKGNWKPMYGFDLNTFKANGFGINYRYRQYDEGFNAELGFVPRPNTKRLTINNGWRKVYKNPKNWSSIYTGNYTTKYWVNSTGKNDFLQSNMYFHVVSKKGSILSTYLPLYQEDYLSFPWAISKDLIIPAKVHKMWKMSTSYTSSRSKAYQYIIEADLGEFYGGNQFSSTVRFNYDVTKAFKLEIGATHNYLRFPSEYATNTSRKLNLNRYFSRLKLNFSARSALNTYLQYDNKSGKAGVNFRFRYNPIEGTDLYIVYNHNANINTDLSPKPPFTDSQVFVVKFSKTFL
jgi:hypothetical protein